MGLCQYVDLCFHASSLPCLRTFCHAIPTSFYVYNVFYFLVYYCSLIMHAGYTWLVSYTLYLYIYQLNSPFMYTLSEALIFKESV